MSKLTRSVGPAALAVGLVAAFAACGDDAVDDDAAEDTAPPLGTVTIAPRSYVMKQPLAATSTTDPSGVQPGEVVEHEQEYTVQPGDFVYRIADRHEVDAQELANYNRWEQGINQDLHAGMVIKIPPGGVVPTDIATTTTTTTVVLAGQAEAEAAGGDTDDGVADVTQGAGDNCAEGTYQLEANDYPTGVASKFDVSLDALNAANADTPGYSAFYVGLEIVIPAKSDC